MKLDWRKITRNFLLPESSTKHNIVKLIDQILEQISTFNIKDQYQYVQLKEINEQLEDLKLVTNKLLTENNDLKNKIKMLEENKINEFLD